MIVCGGDGTINEAVNGLALTKTRLGILPGGTANIIARELGLPLDLVTAARELPGWRPRAVPLGLATWSTGVDTKTDIAPPSCGSQSPRPESSGGAEAPPFRGLFQDPAKSTESRRYFLSVGGIGFDAHVIDQLKHHFKRFLGAWAYGLEAARQVTRYGFPPFICRADGKQMVAGFAAIQRTSRYGGWFRMAPGARFFEPRLKVCLFRSRRWQRYLVYAAALVARRHPQLADVAVIETERVECSPGEPGARILFEVDGELSGALPARFEVVPDAVTLLTP